MLITLLLFYCCFFPVSLSHPLGYYTIVAPGTVRSNSEYQVSITLDSAQQTCFFNISIDEFRFGRKEIVLWKLVKVDPNSTELIKFQIPKLYYGTGSLMVFAYHGIIRRDTRSVSIEEREYSVFIQTDKSKYKPGEKLQFRVIFIDPLTRPANLNDVIDVNIYDGCSHLIKKFADIKPVQGVFRGELQLSESLVLGEWSIEVSAYGTLLKKESFDVARYLLSSFSVKVDVLKKIAVDDEKIVIKIKSRYTFDKPVKGYLTIDIKPNGVTPYKSVHNTTDFDGEKTLTINIEKDLGISKDSFKPWVAHGVEFLQPKQDCSFAVAVTIEESLTGQSSTKNTEFTIYPNPYIVKLKAPDTFNIDGFVNVSIFVTDLQGFPINDTKTPIHLIANPTHFDDEYMNQIVFESYGDFQSHTKETEPMDLQTNLNAFGIGTIFFKLQQPEKFAEYAIRARYLEYVTFATKLRKNFASTLSIDVLTERPEIGKEILFKISSKDVLSYFAYEVVARGNILDANCINLPSNQTTYILSFNATYAMVPKITLFVHRIKRGILNSRLKEVRIKRSFQNSIKISSDSLVHPGDLLSLNITTNKGSYAGLMAVDERLLLATDYKTTLNEDNIFTELRNYDSINIDFSLYPGGEAGLITMSNSRNRAGTVIGQRPLIIGGVWGDVSARADFDKPTITLPRVRKIFSDSFLFKDFERIPEGFLALRETVPDTITTWSITGFSLNPDTGLTLTKNATALRVFRDFFISMDLPSTVKTGEQIDVPVLIFNYLDQEVFTNLTLELILFDTITSKYLSQLNQSISLSITKKGKEKCIFPIYLQKPGKYNITVKAISHIASDAVEKLINVQPEGIPYSFSKTHLMDLREGNQDQQNTILIDIPRGIIEESESIKISVVGDIIGPLLRSIQNLVRVPFGNGENNMRYFVTNLLVLKYLKTMNHSNPSLESKTKFHLELGYQTQLKFSHLDGSFSLFDRTVDRSGDIWVTAYTVWAFQQAKPFLHVDLKVIEKGLKYLKSKQMQNGSFVSAKGAESDVTLTSLTMLTFLFEEQSQNGFRDLIDRGFEYLYDILDELEEPRSAAMASYVLVLGKHEKSKQLLEKISNLAEVKTKELHWTKPDCLESNLITTTYTLMSLLESEDIPLKSLFPVLRSLISAGQGQHTAAHVLALEAMIKFANIIDCSKNNLNIYYETDQGQSGHLQVNPYNSQTLQEVEIKGSTRMVKFQATGNGLSLVSLNYRYNIPAVREKSSSNFKTNITVNELTEWTLALNICITRQFINESESNLSVLEINLASAYRTYENSFQAIMESNKHVKEMKSEDDGQNVRVYFEDIPNSGTCIELGCTKIADIRNLKPITVIAYDIGNEDTRSIFQHKIN